MIDPIIQAQHVQEARFGFLFEDMERKEFERMYPDAESSGSDSDFDSAGNFASWVSDVYKRQGIALAISIAGSVMSQCVLQTTFG